MNLSLQGLLKLILDPRFLTLGVVSLLLLGLILLLGTALLPFGAAVVLTYFLDGGVKRLMRLGLSRGISFSVVYLAFLLVYVFTFLGPVRLAIQQGVSVVRNLPDLENALQRIQTQLPQLLPGLIPVQQQENLTAHLLDQATTVGQHLLLTGMHGLPNVAAWLTYALLVPLLVFFFLKDKTALLVAFERIVPKDRELLDKIWLDVEEKTASYVRGTLWRILIVGIVTWLVLLTLGFQYAAIVGLMSGLSVLVPYVGALAVTTPLLVLGYAQWGIGWQFIGLVVAFLVIQGLDGYLLVPLLFSRAVKLHPVTILLAVFVFGTLWGFWGFFFAIPLATLVKSFVLTVIEHQDKLA